MPTQVKGTVLSTADGRVVSPVKENAQECMERIAASKEQDASHWIEFGHPDGYAVFLHKDLVASIVQLKSDEFNVITQTEARLMQAQQAQMGRPILVPPAALITAG